MQDSWEIVPPEAPSHVKFFVTGKDGKRHVLLPGDVILTQGCAPQAYLIRGATLTSYSHAMTYVGHGKIVEAVGLGVLHRSLSEALHGANLRTVFRLPKLKPEQAQRIVAFVQEQVGGSYTKRGAIGASIIGMVVGAAFSLGYSAARQYAHDNRDEEDTTYFCSELVAMAYREAGVPLGWLGNTPSLVNPGDLARSQLEKICDIA